MIYYLIALVALIYAACDPQEKRSVDPMEIDAKASQSGIPMTGADSAHAIIAFQAIDRQCGSCHHGDRSTNMGALAIFNLQEACWYCPLTQEQAESLTGRVSGSSFSEEERTAIGNLLEELKDDDRSHRKMKSRTANTSRR